MHNRDLEMVSEWQLFGGQLQDLSVQSTFADLQGQVLQNSWHDDSAGELLYQRPKAGFLEDSTGHYSFDVINSKQPSSLTVREVPSEYYEDDLYDILSSSPEEAFLPVDDDNAMGDVASSEDNSFNVVVPLYSDSDVFKPKFDYKHFLSGQQYPTSIAPQNLYENQKIHIEVSRDLTEVNKAIGTDCFAGEQRGLYVDSLYHENQYRPAAELDGIGCAYDSLLDPDNVCKILQELVDNNSDPYPCKPLLLSVSPEEVDSVLSNVSSPRSEDYDSGCVPCSPPVSGTGFLSLSDVATSSAAVLATDYRQDYLSSTASISVNHSSSSSAPYRVEPRTDRKLKKKEQNKTAALRYRNKKREEKGVVYTEVEELEHKNAKLQERADDLTKEINYLKGLLEEIKKQ